MIRTADVVERARELGAQLAGVASADELADLPHPPHAVLNGARSVVVLARRFVYGGVLRRDARSRSHHYATELGLTELEEITLDLMFWLEDDGHPSLMVPASASRSKQEDLASQGPLSLTDAAVAAGLGTLGLNGMLLTPRFGPRVILSAVVTMAPLEPSARIGRGLCLGEECGRCLLACPGSAVRRWGLDVEACRPHSAPYDYPSFAKHVSRIAAEPDPERKWELAASTESLMFWQSLLRGVGIETGCTRCQDVCPVGEDYAARLAPAMDHIPEQTAAKHAELDRMRRLARAERGETR
ncbi:epoxyqueuosine reductase [Pseudonocardia acaciae]|uniref:epoxyqueuosine reductase n=1 Tax=Pseudonocardia acaciae TaxID=551276 RepID=UPI000687DC85|nr:epoxyqueuosine reductase [Pseudonocardia acaciae]